MNRAISSYSDASSIDEETLLKQELSRLQRQYRIMENERKTVFLIFDLFNQIAIELSKCETHDDATADGDQTARG